MLELKLFSFANWDGDVRRSFTDYLIDYETVPRYKRILNSMIKFDDMYQPLYRRPFRDPFGVIRDENLRRRARRFQIYLNKKDLIATYDDRERRRLVVTSRGRKIFYRDYPLASLRKNKWDGVWTIVMYDIPETMKTQRNWLRRQLVKLGFGSPQKSIWVTPLKVAKPVYGFIEGKGLKNMVWALRAKRVLGMRNREVAYRSWPINKLNKHYTVLAEVAPRIKQAANKMQLLNDWRRCFLAVNAQDPCLPFELLPRDWKGASCEKLFAKFGFKGLIRSLLSRIL